MVVLYLAATDWGGSARTNSIHLDVLETGGKVYTNATIIYANPAYAVVAHQDGKIRVAMSNMPVVYQTRFGYTPEKAAQFLAEEVQTKKRRRAAGIFRQMANQRSAAASRFGQIAPAPYAGFQFCFVNTNWGLGSTEAEFTNAIQVIKANGLQNNFPWLIQDDGWYNNTTNPKVATAIARNFPHGMQWVINYGHSNGFKMGLYFNARWVLDSAYPSCVINQDFLDRNVSNYIAWGADMVFMDGVDSTERAGAEAIISAFRNAALANNLPLRIIINNNGTTDFQPWMQEADGVNCHIDGSPENFPAVFMRIFAQIQNQIPYSGYDCWPDFNAVGTWHNDTNYFKASMGILSVAPFSYFLGTTNWNAATLQILTNCTLRAIHQDTGGRMWSSVPTTASGQIWARKLADGDIAVLFCNATVDTNNNLLDVSLSPTNVALSLAAIGVPTNQVENVCNVFGQTSLTATNSFNWMVGSNSAEAFVFSPANTAASTVAANSYGYLAGGSVNINGTHYVDTYDSGLSGGTVGCNPSAGTITVTNAGIYLVSGTISVGNVSGNGGVSIGVMTNATLAVIFYNQTGNPVLKNGYSPLSFSGVVVSVPAMTTFEFFVDNSQSPSAQQATFFVQKL